MYHSSGLISPFQQQPNYDITANGAIQTSSTASSSSGGSLAAVDSIQQLEQLVHSSNLEGGQQVGQQSSLPPNFYPSYYSALATAAAVQQWGAAMGGGNGGTINSLDSGGVNKKATGRMTYNAEQKRILEHCFSIGKYVNKDQRKELKDKTQLSDKQIKIWFQNRRMKKRILEEWFRATKYVSKGQRKELEEKTRLDDKQIKIWFQNRRMKQKKVEKLQGSNTMDNGEMKGSPSSFSPSNESYQQQRHVGGMVEAGEGVSEMALANVKSEPENGIGIGGSHQQRQQMKSEHNQQEGNGINNGGVVSSYPPYEYSSANPLQQQFPPQGCGPQANSTTNFLSSTYPAYYNNPYVQQAAQQQFYQHYHPTMAAMNLAASNWYANATGGFVGGGQQQHVAAGVELERKFENDVNGRLGNHLLKRE